MTTIGHLKGSCCVEALNWDKVHRMCGSEMSFPMVQVCETRSQSKGIKVSRNAIEDIFRLLLGFWEEVQRLGWDNPTEWRLKSSQCAWPVNRSRLLKSLSIETRPRKNVKMWKMVEHPGGQLRECWFKQILEVISCHSLTWTRLTFSDESLMN